MKLTPADVDDLLAQLKAKLLSAEDVTLDEHAGDLEIPWRSGQTRTVPSGHYTYIIRISHTKVEPVPWAEPRA